MNDLEDRVRAALPRAGGFHRGSGRLGTDDRPRRAPLRRRKSGRPGRRRLTRFTPLAAAAAVVAVTVTTATLAATGGWHDLVSGRPATSTTAVNPPWYWRPGVPNTALVQRGRTRGWLKFRPMCGALVGPVISFDKSTVWYSWATGGYQGLYLCESSASGSQSGPAGRGTPANSEGWARTGYGVAVLSATSVTAVLADGRRVAGRIWRGDGLPYGLWEVSYPATDSAVIVFRNAAGQVVATLYG